MRFQKAFDTKITLNRHTSILCENTDFRILRNEVMWSDLILLNTYFHFSRANLSYLRKIIQRKEMSFSY